MRPRRTLDPCENEALDDLGVCLHHLRGHHAHWEAVQAEAIATFPGLAKILRAGS